MMISRLTTGKSKVGFGKNVSSHASNLHLTDILLKTTQYLLIDISGSFSEESSDVHCLGEDIWVDAWAVSPRHCMQSGSHLFQLRPTKCFEIFNLKFYFE